MKKLPILTAAVALSTIVAATDAQAARCPQSCVSDPDGGEMCWWNSNDMEGIYSACWEDVIYDSEGNELYKYCQGVCNYAE